MFKKIVLTAICCLLIVSVLQARDEVMFSPSVDLTKTVTMMIDSAHQSIIIEAPMITNQKLRQALVDAVNRGVDIHLILGEQAHEGDDYTNADFFSDWEIETYLFHDGVLASRFVVVDSSVAITGNLDFFEAPTETQTDYLLIFYQDSDLVQQLLDGFRHHLDGSHQLPPKKLRVLLTPKSDETVSETTKHPKENQKKKPEEDPVEYVGNNKSHIFHKSTCASARNMSEERKTIMSSREEFIEAGYRPCGRCRP